MTPTELRAIRQRLGLSQSQLAEAMGYSPRQIKYMEAGQRTITRRAQKLLESLERQ